MWRCLNALSFPLSNSWFSRLLANAQAGSVLYSIAVIVSETRESEGNSFFLKLQRFVSKKRNYQLLGLLAVVGRGWWWSNSQKNWFKVWNQKHDATTGARIFIVAFSCLLQGVCLRVSPTKENYPPKQTLIYICFALLYTYNPLSFCIYHYQITNTCFILSNTIIDKSAASSWGSWRWHLLDNCWQVAPHQEHQHPKSYEALAMMLLRIARFPSLPFLCFESLGAHPRFFSKSSHIWVNCPWYMNSSIRRPRRRICRSTLQTPLESTFLWAPWFSSFSANLSETQVFDFPRQAYQQGAPPRPRMPLSSLAKSWQLSLLLRALQVSKSPSCWRPLSWARTIWGNRHPCGHQGLGHPFWDLVCVWKY